MRVNSQPKWSMYSFIHSPTINCVKCKGTHRFGAIAFEIRKQRVKKEEENEKKKKIKRFAEDINDLNIMRKKKQWKSWKSTCRWQMYSFYVMSFLKRCNYLFYVDDHRLFLSIDNMLKMIDVQNLQCDASSPEGLKYYKYNEKKKK